jgi:CheY-like chemotaxis protein
MTDDTATAVPPLVLVVDDNAADRRIIIEALKQFVPTAMVETCDNGLEAIRRIRSEHPNAALNRRPDLVLLDLNMPGIGGHEVLSILKKSQQHRTIPVAVLSSSAAESDLKKAYGNYANCYLLKPSSLEPYLRLIGDCARFWLDVVVPPSSGVPLDRIPAL